MTGAIDTMDATRWKLVLRIGGIVVLVGAAFLAGLFIASLKQIHRDFLCRHVYSDSWTQYRFTFPDDASRRYWACSGFVDTDEFAAFSAPRASIEKVVRGYDVKLESFRDSPIPDRVTEQGPDSWTDEFRDSCWDVQTQSQLLICNGEWKTLLYAPDESRLYICDWGH